MVCTRVCVAGGRRCADLLAESPGPKLLDRRHAESMSELLVFHLAGAIRVDLVERRLEVPALEVTRGPLVQALHVPVPARALRQRRKRLELLQRNRPRAIRVVFGEPRVPQVSQRPLKLRALLLLSLHVRQADVPPALRVEPDVLRAAQALPGVFAGDDDDPSGEIFPFTLLSRRRLGLAAATPRSSPWCQYPSAGFGPSVDMSNPSPCSPSRHTPDASTASEGTGGSPSVATPGGHRVQSSLALSVGPTPTIAGGIASNASDRVSRLFQHRRSTAWFALRTSTSTSSTVYLSDPSGSRGGFWPARLNDSRYSPRGSAIGTRPHAAATTPRDAT